MSSFTSDVLMQNGVKETTKSQNKPQESIREDSDAMDAVGTLEVAVIKSN